MCFAGVTVGCRNNDREVVRSTPRQVATVVSSGYCCLWTGKPSRYIINNKVNSAFHPSGVGKSSTILSGCAAVMAGCVHLCRVIPYGRWRSLALRSVSYFNESRIAAV